MRSKYLSQIKLFLTKIQFFLFCSIVKVRLKTQTGRTPVFLRNDDEDDVEVAVVDTNDDTINANRDDAK